MTDVESIIKQKVILPGGYFHKGNCLREVTLTSPTGKTEELIRNFSNPLNLAVIITLLLVHCVKQIGSIRKITPSIIRSFNVGDREFLIMKIREMTFGEKVEAIITCSSKSCKAIIDIDFKLSDIPIKSGRYNSYNQQVIVKNSKSNSKNSEKLNVEFRLPNGEDQEILGFMILADENTAIQKLLARCIKRINNDDKINEEFIGKLPGSVIDSIDEEFVKIAPGIEQYIKAICPECDNKFRFPLNISQMFYDEMSISLERLYYEIHVLAYFYKWSEKDILSLPRYKRKKYLELLNHHFERKE